MEKKWIALSTAAVLASGLVACSSRAPNYRHNDGLGYGTYTTNPTSSTTTTGVRNNNGAYINGRYAADTDGTVSSGHGVLARDARELGDDLNYGMHTVTRRTGESVGQLGNGITHTAENMY